MFVWLLNGGGERLAHPGGAYKSTWILDRILKLWGCAVWCMLQRDMQKHARKISLYQSDVFDQANNYSTGTVKEILLVGTKSVMKTYLIPFNTLRPL